MAGTQENFLFGAIKKFTINRTLNGCKTVNNNNYNDNGMYGMSNVPTYINNPTDSDQWVEYQIDLPIARRVRGVGFSGNALNMPFSYEILLLKDSTWVSVKSGNCADTVKQTLNPNTCIDWWDGSSSSKLDILGIKFRFYIKKGSTAHIDCVWAKDGTAIDAYLPTFGGTIYGDLNLNKNKLTNIVIENQSTENRPTSPIKGQMIYDSTLNKPIWFNGSTWKDSQGNTV